MYFTPMMFLMGSLCMLSAQESPNPLADQSTSSFARPTAFYRAGVIFGGTIPLDIRVGLQDSAQTLRRDGPLQEQHRIVEAMLTHDSKLNPCIACNYDHPFGRVQIHGHRFLHQNMLSVPGAQFDCREAITGKRADIHVVDARMPTEVFGRC